MRLTIFGKFALFFFEQANGDHVKRVAHHDSADVFHRDSF
jgi:hypothetical protein